LRASPCGVAVLLNCNPGAQALVSQWAMPQPGAAAPSLPQPSAGPLDLRVYGIGAQILRHLGVRRMELLGPARGMPGMTGYGLEVCGFRSPT
jgi:3,4-dihydroxy 2-butanone 4-phosphate synthase / GTP cyclohydrolase II